MEPKNRNIWIIVAVIVIALCCCALAVAAVGAAGWFVGQPFGWRASTSLQGERSEEAFAVGDAPKLKIDNFAGNTTVRTGPSGLVRVAATRRARNRADLARIKVDVSERDGGLLIKTEKPSTLNAASVDLEITVPAGTHLEVDTGAGNVEIDDGSGPITVETGAGNIRYQGAPQGECRFETGAGNTRLTLPADLNVRVDLQTGAGNIDVDFVVDGRVTGRAVQGVIGSGAEGMIYAQTGAGNIDLVRRGD
jgi:hypothetical protein